MSDRTEYAKRYYQKNRKHLLEKSRNRTALNRLLFGRVQDRDSYGESPAERARRNLYGVGRRRFSEMMDAASDRCEICGIPFGESTPPCVDHNHETGVVRGLLCQRCNTALGLFSDRPEVLCRAAAYLTEEYS